MRMPLGRLALLLLLGGPFLAARPVVAAEEPPEVTVPAGRPVQLDGRVVAAEWEQASTQRLDDQGSRLRLMQARGTLLLALDSPLCWGHRAHFTLFFARGDEAENETGAVRIDYEPLEHDRAHVIVRRRGEVGFEPVAGRVVARAALAPGGTQLEMAIGMDALGLTAKDRDTGVLRMALLWTRPLGDTHRTWPRDLDMSATPGKPPPDLASSARWARLTGWVDPESPGYAKREWEELLARDEEITRRGGNAHAAVRELIEERRGIQKVDKEVVPAVFDNLAWVAQHEPLTPSDHLAMAMAHWFLNQHARAVSMLTTLATGRDRSFARRALYDRARVLESMERYVEAERDWRTLASYVTDGPYRRQYEQRAAQAAERQQAWTREQQIRSEEDATGKLPLVELLTNRGVVVLALYPDEVPKAVAHFLALVESNFYDGTLFHRVIGNALAQGGDPTSRDQGCEFAGRGTSPTEIEIEENARHGFWRGAVGFAHGIRERNGSQFFMLTAPRLELAEEKTTYTCFGRVVSGMSAVDRLEHCDKLIRARVLRK